FLLIVDDLLDRRSLAAAPSLGPGNGCKAGIGLLGLPLLGALDGLAPVGIAEQAARRHGRADALRRRFGVEKAAHLAAEGGLVGGVVEIHRGTLLGRVTALERSDEPVFPIGRAADRRRQ